MRQLLRTRRIQRSLIGKRSKSTEAPQKRISNFEQIFPIFPNGLATSVFKTTRVGVNRCAIPLMNERTLARRDTGALHTGRLGS
jgi:hypothetical protein